MAQDPIERHAEIEIELAHEAHEVERELAASHRKQAEAFGLMTIRSIGFVSAGGIAAVLGFFSANYARLIAIPGSLETLNAILATLFVALLLGLGASGAGYWSQTLYAEGKWQQSFNMDRPFVHVTAASKRRFLFGTIFRWASIAFSAAGIAVLVVAGVVFLQLVR